MWYLIAPIVRWPLRSPLRLLSVVVALVVVVIVVGEINGDDSAPTADPTATTQEGDTTDAAGSGVLLPSPSESSTSHSSTPGAAGEDGELLDELAVTEPHAIAADASAAFVAAWARPDLDATSWLKNVEALVTDELYAALQTTDPANTLKVTVAGEPIEVAANAEEAVFDVPTTGVFIRVTVERDRDADVWLVNNVEPAV